MKKLILSLSAVLLANIVSSQCDYPSTSGATTPPSDFENSGLAAYYPTSNGVVTVRLNFMFPKPPPNEPAPGNYWQWSTVTADTTQCQIVVDQLNGHFSNVPQPNYELPPMYQPIQYLSDTKIRFVLGTISTPILSLAHYKNIYSNDLQGLITANGLNNGITIISGVVDSAQGGDAMGIPNNYLVIEHQYKSNTQDQINGPNQLLIAHELGHCLGLYHTDNIVPGLGNYPGPNTTGDVLTQYAINDFWLTENPCGNSCSSQFNGGGSSNNMMSYNWDYRGYFSPKQIGMMHYQLWNSASLKPAVVSYAPLTLPCNILPANDFEVTSYSTWNNNAFLFGNLIIKNGAHLILTANLSMPKDAKIIVQPGCKLSIIGGKITGRPCGTWKGIEVWGTGGPQTLNPQINGMVELDNATIQNAECGILLGKLDGNGAPVNNSGGGIIQSKNSRYLNNRIAVRFLPYLPSSNSDNIGYFIQDTFKVDNNFMGPGKPQAAISLEKVKLVDVSACCFTDHAFSSIGINCSNSSFRLKSYCPTYMGICSGLPLWNKFNGFKYGVFISNLASFDSPSLIDHTVFDQQNGYCTNIRLGRGGLYMVNNFGSVITNCDFHIGSYFNPALPTLNPMVYGLYLDGCSGYVVEKNKFDGTILRYEDPNDNYFTVFQQNCGIFVNNSGSTANSIYNNTFGKLNQGIWAQNKNFSTSTGAGLLLNCNNFVDSTLLLNNSDPTACQYDIGVQDTGPTAPSCMGCPAPSPDAGIATTQGVGTQGVTGYVRNTYGAECTALGENRFYVDTQVPFYTIGHYSYFGFYYEPTSQNVTTHSCSNPGEVSCQWDQNQITPSGPRYSYCPDSDLSGNSLSMLSQGISSYKMQIQSLQTNYAALDNGQTSALYAAINNPGYNELTLFSNLNAPKFLSDAVLGAYLNRRTASVMQRKTIFQKNAPVNPNVWQSVLNMELPSEEMENWEAIQFTGQLSDKNKIETDLVMAHTKMELLYNEKIRRFLSDSTGPQIDSVVAIYDQNIIPESNYKKADLLVSAARYPEAQNVISQLSEDTDNSHFCTLLNHVFQIKRDSTYLKTLQSDSANFDYFSKVASSNNALVERYGKALLHTVYNYQYEEIKLSPVPTSGERKATIQKNNETSNPKKLQLVSGISIYPNPASSQLSIIVDKEGQEMELQIIDLTGKILLKQSCSSNTLLDVSSLQNGLYFINLYKEDKFLTANKIVITK